MSLLTIRLAYDLLHLFPFLYRNMKVKEAKLKLNFIIYLAHDYKDRSLSKHSKRKDRTKLFIQLNHRKTKDQTKVYKNKNKDSGVIQYWGTSPKLGSSQGECPYPILNPPWVVKMEKNCTSLPRGTALYE